MQRGAQDYLPKDGLTSDFLFRSILYACERNRLRAGLKRLNDQLQHAKNELQSAQNGVRLAGYYIRAVPADGFGRHLLDRRHDVAPTRGLTVLPPSPASLEHRPAWRSSTRR